MYDPTAKERANGIFSILQEYGCGCEICEHSASACPASASSFAEEIWELRRRITDTAAAYASLAADRDRAYARGWSDHKVKSLEIISDYKLEDTAPHSPAYWAAHEIGALIETDGDSIE